MAVKLRILCPQVARNHGIGSLGPIALSSVSHWAHRPQLRPLGGAKTQMSNTVNEFIGASDLTRLVIYRCVYIHCARRSLDKNIVGAVAIRPRRSECNVYSVFVITCHVMIPWSLSDRPSSSASDMTGCRIYTDLYTD